MEPMTLRAGALSLTFEPWSGMIRHVRLGGVEVLRGVYAAVRDESWGTHSHEVREVQNDTTEAGFALTWRDSSGPVEFEGRLLGGADGIEYGVVGRVGSDFRTMRTGLCVLHPAKECAGAKCRVEHTDGSVQEGSFPDLISPHQPFFDIRAIEHEVGSGVWVRTEMLGEVFEMEDQRNWTDASFKTYCRPLDAPRPYPLQAGEEIAHTVRVRLIGAPAEVPANASDTEVVLTVGDAVGHFPEIGTLYRSGAEFGPLLEIGLHHLAVELDPEAEGAEETIEEAANLSEALDCDLEIHLVGGSAEAAEELERHLMIDRFVARGVDSLRALRAVHPRADVLIGTGSNFTELNRERPSCDEIDGIAFATDAQVHAFDDVSIVETLEGLREVVRSARALCHGKPVRVGPVRFARKEDPRLATPFGAAWTLAAVKNLAEAGADALTIHEATGPMGLSGTPAGDALKTLMTLPGGEIRACESTAPLRVQGLAVGSVVLAISLSANTERVRVGDQSVELAPFEIRRMDETVDPAAANVTA